MNKRLCAFIKIRVVRMGALQHTRMVSEPHSHVTWTLMWSAKVFWVYFLRICIKNEEKPSISTCANTVRLPDPSPLLSLPTSVQNRYFQRHSGAKTERRHGRCSDLSAQRAHPTKGSCHPGYLSYNNYTRSSEAAQECSAIYCTRKTHIHAQKYLQCYSLYVEGIFLVWPTDSPDNNEQAC